MTFLATEKTNVEDTGVNLFIEIYKDKAKFEAWLRSYLSEVQALETAVWEVINERAFPNAIGQQLTNIGKIVGQGRTTSDDVNFLIDVKAKIATNISKGLPDNLLELTRILLPVLVSGSDDYTLTEYFPAQVVIELFNTDAFPISFDPYRIANALYKARAGGVAFRLIYANHAPSRSFTFSDAQDPQPVTSSAQGYAHTSGSNGGKLAAAIDPTPQHLGDPADVPGPAGSGFSSGFSGGFS